MKRHTVDPVEAERVEEEAGRVRTERGGSEEPADRRLFEFGAARDTKTAVTGGGGETREGTDDWTESRVDELAPFVGVGRGGGG